MKQTTEPFEELMIPRRDLPVSSAIIYRVYSDYKNFELVEASSALEAMENSKIKNVYKIKRHDPLEENVIHMNRDVKNIIKDNVITPLPQAEISPVSEPVQVAEVAEVVEPAVAPEPIAEEPVAVESASSEPAALSNEDVDKLLNG
jgi:hypothetical protein